MGFLYPLGLLALVSLPIVAALHLFRRRFQPLEVSALFLWHEEDQSLDAGRRVERLRASPSLWLELLAAALLALLLAGPRGPWTSEAQHLVCVLDSSASMGARDPDAALDLTERARAEILRRIDALESDSTVTLVQSGRRPRLLCGPGAFPGDARLALASHRPLQGQHDLGPALALGIELAAGGAVLLVTDHSPASGLPPEVELCALGSPLDNVALLHASRVRAAGGDAATEPHDRLLLTVAALTGSAVTRELTVTAEGQPLLRRQLELEPDRRLHVTVDLPPGTGAVVAQLEPDALAVDDRAHLVPVPARPLRLACTLDPAEALALGLAEAGPGANLARWSSLVPEAQAADSAEAADLVIGATPQGGERSWNLVLVDDEAESDRWVGPFLTQRQHPLLEGVSLEGVRWAASRSSVLAGLPLISVGGRPLLTEELLPGGRRVHRLALDVGRSTLQRSPDWPILLTNLAELRRSELPGALRANVVLGEEFVYRHAGPGEFELVPLEEGSPVGLTSLQRDLVVDELPGTGFFALRRGAQELVRFGANFSDADESDLRHMVARQEPSPMELARIAAETSALDTLLLCGALAALLLDWWILTRGARPRARAATA